jgi:hypothetical protein
MVSKVLPLVPWHRTELSTASYSGQSAQAVHEQALDLFVLGFPEQANTLLKALYDHGHGLEFDVDIYTHPKSYDLSWEFVGYLMCLYAAWEAFDCLPSWIEHPDPEKPFHGRDHLVRTEPLWNEYKGRWVEGFPSNLRGNVLEEGQIEKSELQDLLQQLENQKSRVVAKTRISIGAVVQAATLAGDDRAAKSLVENDVANLYRHFQDPSNQPDVYSYDLRVRLSQRLGLHYGPKIWGYLKDASIGTALEIDGSAVDEFVDEGCELIKQRFAEGPTRPYSDRTIADLVDLLDEAYNTQASLNGEDRHQTRRKPATEKEITDLEYNLCSAVGLGATRLLDGEALPEDYREFLRITNGFWSENNPDNLFYSIEDIDTSDDCLWVHDLNFPLFPWETTYTFQDEIALGEFTGFSVGAGGDEGSAILIPPSSMKEILERFDEVYAAADARGKKLLERGALDVYGGSKRLRKMEWLCVESFHWDPEPRLFYGFRGYLEYCVEKAVREADELHESESEEEENDEVEGGEDDESDTAKGTKRKRDREVDEA